MGHTGKQDDRFMEDIVYANLGLPSKKLVMGPGRGLDNGMISIGNENVMILTMDPISAMPALGMRLSAWLSVHLIASDYTSSGADPEFALFSYNFPEAMNRSKRERYIKAISDECRALDVSIAGGHTGSYPGGGFTVIGTGAMLGFAPEDKVVSPSMARVGDSVLMTKHAAIEATMSLAFSFPEFTSKKAGSELAGRARAMAELCSTVRDARSARRVGLGPGGVSSMHDATEGGVLGALAEIAAASRKRLVVDPARIPVTVETRAVCTAFGIDPLRTMGEGSLLITCSSDRVQQLVRVLNRNSVSATEIGEVREGKELVLRHQDGRTEVFTPGADQYWVAYDRAVRCGLK